MATNEPVHAFIIKPTPEFAMPIHEEIWLAGMSTFSSHAQQRTIVLPYRYSIRGADYIDRLESFVTGVRYESGKEGMLTIELKPTRLWTKIHGFYNSRPGCYDDHGWLSLTRRR